MSAGYVDKEFLEDVAQCRPTRRHSIMTSEHPFDLATARICAILPVFNDWEAATEVVRRLDSVATVEAFSLEVVLVDDGSTEAPALGSLELRRIETVRVVSLRRNVGHQRAIAIGLAY